MVDAAIRERRIVGSHPGYNTREFEPHFFEAVWQAASIEHPEDNHALDAARFQNPTKTRPIQFWIAEPKLIEEVTTVVTATAASLDPAGNCGMTAEGMRIVVRVQERQRVMIVRHSRFREFRHEVRDDGIPPVTQFCGDLLDPGSCGGGDTQIVPKGQGYRVLGDGCVAGDHRHGDGSLRHLGHGLEQTTQDPDAVNGGYSGLRVICSSDLRSQLRREPTYCDGHNTCVFSIKLDGLSVAYPEPPFRKFAKERVHDGFTGNTQP
jgi:hypothetical protein